MLRNMRPNFISSRQETKRPTGKESSGFCASIDKQEGCSSRSPLTKIGISANPWGARTGSWFAGDKREREGTRQMKPPVRGRWRLYGLNVESDIPLPCPPAMGDGTDLTIRWLGSAPRLSPARPSPWRTWKKEDEGWILLYCNPNGTYLEIVLEPDGSAISLSHHSPFDWPDFLTILLGPAMGAALRLQKTPVLHGGAVVIEGGAALLLSASGGGKTTLTAALVNAGQPLLSDEVIALSLDGGGISVPPGPSLLKLSPRAVTALGKSPAALPLVSPGFKLPEERWLEATTLKGGCHNAPAPLRVVYLLAGRRPGLRRPQIAPLAPAEASIALGRHSYGTPWLSPPPEEAMRLWARIAGTVPVRRVWMPEGLSSVSAAARALAADALSRPSDRSPWREARRGS
jgi:hypothetical protein